MKHKYINTLWEVRTYDVWGNAKDGYEVNDSFVVHREYPLRLRVYTYNFGTGQEFDGAYPSEKQIREAIGIKPRLRLDIDGDDLNISVSLARDGYPLGEMFCVSHESLSPIEPRSE